MYLGHIYPPPFYRLLKPHPILLPVSLLFNHCYHHDKHYNPVCPNNSSHICKGIVHVLEHQPHWGRKSTLPLSIAITRQNSIIRGGNLKAPPIHVVMLADLISCPSWIDNHMWVHECMLSCPEILFLYQSSLTSGSDNLLLFFSVMLSGPLGKRMWYRYPS